MKFDPSTAPEDRIVDAKLIKKWILNGTPVHIEHGIIRGSLALDSLNCQNQLTLRQCTIEEQANFSFSSFERQVDLTGTEFRHGAKFEFTSLKQDLILDRCRFCEGEFVLNDSVVKGRFFARGVVVEATVYVSFDSIRFERKALLNESVFKEKISFRNSCFASGVEFLGVSFLSEADFSNMICGADLRFGRGNRTGPAVSSTFLGPAKFDGVRISGRSHLESARFNSLASFKQATFSQDAFFQGAVFDKSVSFFGSRLGPSEFYGLYCRGPADFSSTVFDGDVSFDRDPNDTTRPAQFDEGADFTGTEVHGQFSFQNVKVTGDTSFNGAVIKSDAYFSSEIPDSGGCEFDGEADFIGIHVDGMVYFDRAKFSKKAQFKKAHLSQSAQFRCCRFASIADFSGVEVGADFQVNRSEFNDDARFDRCRVDGLEDFASVQFQRVVNFDGSSCAGAANFTNVTFHSEASFQGANFRGEAQFQATQFGGKACFVDCNFAALASFSGTTSRQPTRFCSVAFDHSRFFGDARFEDCLFLKPASFADVSFRSVTFETASEQFKSTVNLSGCKYDRIVTNWNHLLFTGDQSRLKPYDRQAGIQLENTLRKIGDDEDATDLYLKRKSVERRQKWEKKEYLPWFADAMYRLFANYGVRPRTLLVSMIVLVAVGTLIFQFPSTVVSDQAQSGEVRNPGSWSLLQAFGVSIHQFLPVDVPVGSTWKPSPEQLDISVAGHRIVSRYIRPTGLATILLRIPGWLFVPLAVANLAGLLNRPVTITD